MSTSFKPPFSKEDILRDFWQCTRKTLVNSSAKEFIVTNQGVLTFGEAEIQSNRIAAVLKEKAGSKTKGVALFLTDPLKIIPCMMAVQKSGFYLTVLDITFPKATLKSMIQDAEIGLVVTHSQILGQIRSVTRNSLPIVNIDDLDMNVVPTVEVFRFSNEDKIQIMFTSGSTGKPKGAIKHYGYHVHSVYGHLNSYSYKPDDRVLHTTPFTYSGSHSVVYGSLVTGYSIYYYDIHGEGLSGLADWIRDNQITFYNSTATTFRSFASILKPSVNFPSVRVCNLAGEKRVKSDIISISKLFPNIKAIRVGYGGTETHGVTSSMFSPEELLEMDELPSGTPYEGTQVLIWDEYGNKVPKGDEGEIVVYGESLARGYINNRELTDQRFIPDPEKPGWQFVKTGDLGKILKNGQLVHLGRIDNMVKINGVRIELDNIENTISSYPGIIHVAIKTFDDQSGGKKLAAYFTAKKAITVPISDLRKHLAQRLPPQQLPGYLIYLDQMPLTNSGKVAVEQLPLPKTTRPELDNPYIPASTITEETIKAIWEKNIGIFGLGVTDDFFQVGGDSLIGLIVFVAIKEEMGILLPVSTLIRASTIRDLARIIDASDRPDSKSAFISINPDGTKSPLFFIPGKGGDPIRVKHLSRYLDNRIPVFAFQTPVRKGSSFTANQLEKTASELLHIIRNINPKGFRVLVGESIGGKLAYEIAQQLVLSGERPPLVFLLDTGNMENNLSSIYTNKDKWPYYRNLVKKHASIWFGSSKEGKKEYLHYYYIKLRQNFSKSVVKKTNKDNERSLSYLPDELIRIEMENKQAANEYEAKPYPGRVVLVIASRGCMPDDTAHGWDSIGIKDLAIEHLDCYHGSMLFDPAVSELAKIIQSHIQD